MSGSRAWLGFALLSAASFAAMAACVRIASAHLPTSEVVFFRNAMALVFLWPLLVRRRVSLATRRFALHLLRAMAGLAAMALYFHALARLPLADAILLNYTSPLFVALIAVAWLGERPTRTRWAALGLGMLGVALLFRPSSAVASAAGIAGLASGALAGLALATVKRLSDTEPPERIVAWFAILATVASAPAAWADFVRPSAADGWAILGLGAFGSIGQLGMTWAYERAPASRVSPIGYTSLVFAALLGWVLWGELPDAWGALGGVLIAGAGWLVARERATPAPTPPSAAPAARV